MERRLPMRKYIRKVSTLLETISIVVTVISIIGDDMWGSERLPYFKISVKEFAAKTNSICIRAKAGRCGETYERYCI